MDQHSDPIQFLIDFAWSNHADLFVVNNAKDQLKKLVQDSEELSVLKTEHQKLLQVFEKPIAYGLMNDKQDLYDLRIMNNPHNDQTKVVPLYSNRTEFLSGDWKGYNCYGKSTN
jgi:hypothetical protein